MCFDNLKFLDRKEMYLTEERVYILVIAAFYKGILVVLNLHTKRPQ